MELRVSRGFGSLRADLGQLAGVKPIPRTIGTFVDFDAAFGAEEMAVQLHARATRALTLAGAVNHQPLVVLDLQQPLTCRFVRFVHPLQFEGIEPNPAASALANIHRQVAYLDQG